MKKGGIWRDIYGTDEKKVAAVVREDKVDILVELTGHTANNKLGLMACRPAPIQVLQLLSVVFSVHWCVLLLVLILVHVCLVTPFVTVA